MGNQLYPTLLLIHAHNTCPVHTDFHLDPSPCLVLYKMFECSWYAVYVNMVVADAPAPNRCQGIYSHQADSTMTIVLYEPFYRR